MVDTRDLKSLGLIRPVPVQVRPPAYKTMERRATLIYTEVCGLEDHEIRVNPVRVLP
jgi:hypothetical protein